uniref:DNA polymerase IV n=1 Tax=Candidatus Methanomethylicus mesodigestus TaxID=1867258 RepID=A0A7C3ILH7_9CREN
MIGKGERFNRRIVMLADIDYFYAQVEERDNPLLKGKPVIVCVFSGRTEDSGVVATANYEARKYGVKSGIPIALAKKKLLNADAKFIPMRHDYYKTVSEKVMAILRDKADAFEQVGIDEAYLDVSLKINGFDDAERLAGMIAEEVMSKERLTLSIGIGPNKVIAKMASDLSKPNGIKAIRPEDVVNVIHPLSVDRLPGVGKKTYDRMVEAGIATVGDLAHFDRAKLVNLFGISLGNYFHNAANGVDDDLVHEKGEQESISRIVTLKEDTNELEAVMESIRPLCEDIADKTSKRGLLFRSIGIIAITKDLGIRTRSKSLNVATNDKVILIKVTDELFSKYLEESKVKLRRAGVLVSNFEKKGTGQDVLTRYF